MMKLKGERKQDAAMNDAKFCGVAAAMLGAAAIGAGASTIAGNKSSKAMQQGAGQANAESARQYDQTRQDQMDLLTQQRADQAPWLDAGKNALSQLVGGMQPGGQFTQPFQMSDFQKDPGYQFRQEQGQQALERSAAARGGLLSGAALKATAQFSQGLASEEYGNALSRFENKQTTGFNRLATLAGVGQTATSQIGQAGQNAFGTIAQAGQNSSNAIQNNLMGVANARASSYVNTANGFNNAMGQAFNGYQQNKLFGMMQRQNQLGIANSSADPIASMNAQNGWTS